MKKLFVLFLVIILVTGCNQPQPESRQVEMGLYTPYYLFPETINGKVKSFIEKNYMAVEKDGKYVKDIPLTVEARDSIGWTTDFELRYDANGNLFYSADIDENNKVINRWDVKSEDNKMVQCGLTRDDTLRLVAKLTYDDSGVLTKIQHFRMPPDTLFFQSRIIYDENGNMVEWVFQTPGGETTGKNVFTVNLDGERTGYKYYNKDGDQTFEQQFTYNEKGNMIKQVLINSEGKKYVSDFHYSGYDKMDNWTSSHGNSDKHMIITERTITYHE